MSTLHNNFQNLSTQVSVGPGNASGTSSVVSTYKTTEAQLEVWLSSQQSVEANCSYNEISSICLRGELDQNAFVKALSLVVDRNASLRTTFSEDGLQVHVHSHLDYAFETFDWSQEVNLDPAQKNLEVVQKQACTPFDLVKGPLLRVALQKYSATNHRMTFSAHHIVLDGWSLAVFCRDLGRFYDSIRTGKQAKLPEASQYDEYARAESEYFASTEGQSDEDFWVSQFEDSIPVLDLPTENPRPALRTYYGRRYSHYIPSDHVRQLKKLGAKNGCSLFNTMLAAFESFVARLSGTYDFCLGIPTSGQAAMDQPELIGHCVNTIPLRTQVDPADPFLTYLKKSQRELLDALEHQRYSYGTLLRRLAPPRDPSRPPMLSVSFNIDPVLDTSEMGFEGLEIDVVVEPRSFENFEWFINGVINKDESLELQIQYNAELYTRQSMEFYFEGFQAFLESIIQMPDQPLYDYPMMSVEQRNQVLVQWNETELEYPLESTLHSEFSRQATETPTKVAVQFEDRKLTYAEVETQANQISRYLNQQGLGAGDLVGICVDRNEQMLVTLLGILKSGAGYVPLDPAYPTDRLQYMCEHSQLKVVLTQASLANRAEEFGKPTLVLDEVRSNVEQMDSQPLNLDIEPSNTCYVIYTSGSTGKPKGVQVPHGTVVNFLYSMRQQPGFTANDSIMAVTTLSFDIAVLELYLPTITGGKTVIASSEVAVDGTKLITAMEANDVTFLQATPATWRMLIQSGWQGSDKLKVLCGGEPMPADLVEPLLERCSELWNMYGPTETTVWSAAYQITNAKAPILIGKPIGNTQIFILDQQGKEVPIGCEGEVFIGGAGVTHGYLHQPNLTSERFIDNPYFDPFANLINHRLYKTGDLAKFRFDGNIQFLRRDDKQVKVRGFRIELGEIEQQLKSHDSIEQALVVVREDSEGDARLVAYLVAKSSQELDYQELRSHMRDRVPYYMVPQHFITLSAFPKTSNGKIDYKSLPAPNEQAGTETVVLSLPETASQKLLATIWSDVLEVSEISLMDNFFDLGGHSLLVMKVIAKVEEATGHRLSPQDFLVGTLEQMATLFNADDSKASPTVEAKAKPETNESLNKSKSNGSSNPSDSDSKPGLIKKLKGFWD